MLHPFLFIGVGGSGGKTLRTLKADLTQRLLEASYSGPWPTCWQFLHIDVPTVPDGNEQDLPGQLDEKDYVGLVGRQIDYRTIDDALMAGGNADEQQLRNLLGWRPEPRRVVVPVARGAGQYRVLGRAITLTNLDAVAEAVRRATDALHGPQMVADLGTISRLFNAPVADNAPGPEVVVVSSLAGGSGSGAFLDVCDVLRAVGGGGWSDESFAVLFAPDVFHDLSPEESKGIHANALAALCELMAGFWDPEPAISDFAIMQGKGIAAGAPQRRGPRFPFIVGRKNDEVGFSHQNDVYRAVGKALAAWVVSENLQNKLKAYATGNWAQSSQIEDRTRLRSLEQEEPLGSIGFARVSLGRDRFAEYASQRIARGAVDRVLRQHLAHRPPDADPNHEVAIEEAVTSTFAAFLDASGLDERGADRNQILDAVRPTDREERLTTATEVVRSTLVAGRSAAVPARQWLAEAIDVLREQQRRFADEEVVRRNEQTRDWVRSIQEHLVTLVGQSVASYGAPVTDRLIERLAGELTSVLTELPDEEAKYRHWAQQLDQLVSGVLKPTNDALQPDNPVILQAIQKGVDCFDYLAEAELRAFTTALVKDLLSNLVEPMLTAVRGGRELLTVRATGSGNVHTEVETWPVGELVPRRFHPAGNEFLLEPVDAFPAIFNEVLTRAASVKDPGGAEAEFVRHAIVGSWPTDLDAQSLIATQTGWVPALAELQASFGSSARARFELQLDPTAILNRARALIDDRDSPIGVLVGESLQDYLDDRKVEPAELQRRIDRFHDAFVQVLQTSAPLVNIDPKVLTRVHESNKPGISYMFTEIPFPEGTPGYECVREVLQSRGQWDANVSSAFTEGRESRIDVFSILASSYNPMVFESIVGPIADEWSRRRGTADQRDGFWRWRRARPLPSFLPLAPEVRLALVRGWFTGRLLGEIEFDASDREKMKIWDPTRAQLLPFPYPLLGATVFEDYERLPAILESLPIALIEYAERASDGDAALAPYWRLRDLGKDARDAEKDYDGLNKVLDAWVRFGTTATSAPTPKPEMSGTSAGDAEQRRDRCLATVRKWHQRYHDQVSTPITTENFFKTPRIAELGHDVLTALQDLDTALTRVSANVDSDDY